MAMGIPAGVLSGRATDKCYGGPPKGMILTSLTDLFKIGPGPSSSQTIAPLRIAEHFRKTLTEMPREQIVNGQTIEVRLYGSLSATGRGHHTDRAILAGLLGEKSETCDTKLMDLLGDATKKHPTTINGRTFMIGHDMIVWDKIDHPYPYANTMIMRLVGKDGSSLFEREYYSPGGGFFLWKGQPEADRGKPLYPYHCMTQFKALASEHRKSLHEIIMENEKAIMKVSDREINAHLDLVLKGQRGGMPRGDGSDTRLRRHHARNRHRDEGDETVPGRHASWTYGGRPGGFPMQEQREHCRGGSGVSGGDRCSGCNGGCHDHLCHRRIS